jgi:hypothetical protein
VKGVFSLGVSVSCFYLYQIIKKKIPLLKIGFSYLSDLGILQLIYKGAWAVRCFLGSYIVIVIFFRFSLSSQ